MPEERFYILHTRHLLMFKYLNVPEEQDRINIVCLCPRTWCQCALRISNLWKYGQGEHQFMGVLSKNIVLVTEEIVTLKHQTHSLLLINNEFLVQNLGVEEGEENLLILWPRMQSLFLFSFPRNLIMHNSAKTYSLLKVRRDLLQLKIQTYLNMRHCFSFGKGKKYWIYILLLPL